MNALRELKEMTNDWEQHPVTDRAIFYGMTDDWKRGRKGLIRKGEGAHQTFAAFPAPSSVSREQGIMEMYKCKRGGVWQTERKRERQRGEQTRAGGRQSDAIGWPL